MSLAKGLFFKSNTTGKVYVTTGKGAFHDGDEWNYSATAYRSIVGPKVDEVFIVRDDYFDDNMTDITDLIVAAANPLQTIQYNPDQLQAVRDLTAEDQ